MTASVFKPVLVCMCVTTFPTFHGLNEDASAVGQDPVPAAVAVLAVHHGAQRMGDLKQLPPGLMMLLQNTNRRRLLSEDTN